MSNEIEFNLRDGDVDVAQKKKRVTNYEIFSMVLAEVIGTAMLVLFGCMGAVWWGKEPPRMPTPQLNFGLTVMLIIHIFGHISYALINPAVTIAAVVNKLITWQVSSLDYTLFRAKKDKPNCIIDVDWNTTESGASYRRECWIWNFNVDNSRRDFRLSRGWHMCDRDSFKC